MSRRLAEQVDVALERSRDQRRVRRVPFFDDAVEDER